MSRWSINGYSGPGKRGLRPEGDGNVMMTPGELWGGECE